MTPQSGLIEVVRSVYVQPTTNYLDKFKLK